MKKRKAEEEVDKNSADSTTLSTNSSDEGEELSGGNSDGIGLACDAVDEAQVNRAFVSFQFAYTWIIQNMGVRYMPEHTSLKRGVPGDIALKVKTSNEAIVFITCQTVTSLQEAKNASYHFVNKCTNDNSYKSPSVVYLMNIMCEDVAISDERMLCDFLSCNQAHIPVQVNKQKSEYFENFFEEVSA